MTKAKTFFIWLPLSVNQFTTANAIFILPGMGFLQPLESVRFLFQVTAEHAEDASGSVASCGFKDVCFIPTAKIIKKDGDTMSDIYNRIVSRQQTPVRVTIPSTRDVQQAIGIISRQIMADSAELAKYTHPVAMSCFGIEKACIPAFFLPDTYEVYWDITAEDFFEKMAGWNRKYWNDERKAKAKALGLTPAEVSTLASIVDEETTNVAEMPTVAGLYINRLKRGMPLQADPTVKFALGDPTRRRILNKDLEVNSPYNTYKNTGLPPGPIRIPTKQAIESVLNYEKHNYLYMCAKEDLSGTHNFAKTLSEHNANARRYQQALNKLNIKK